MLWGFETMSLFSQAVLTRGALNFPGMPAQEVVLGFCSLSPGFLQSSMAAVPEQEYRPFGLNQSAFKCSFFLRCKVLCKA